MKALVTLCKQHNRRMLNDSAIFGSHSAKHVECILGCDVTHSSKTMPSFRRKALPPYSGQKWYIEAVGSSKTFLNFYQTSFFTAKILH